MVLLRRERTCIQSKLRQYKKYDINVGNATHDELVELVGQIRLKELEELLADADRAGKVDILRKKWRQDVEERIDFDRDQKKNGECMNMLSIIVCFIALPSTQSQGILATGGV